MTAPPRQTVLIVDDDRTNRLILAGALKDECQVILAKDGASALRVARENAGIRLVRLDVSMPDLDGYEVLRELKADPRTADIPVVFITGNTEEKEEEYGLTLGAADYVFKPVRPAIVRARIRNLLKMATLGRTVASSTLRDEATGLFSRCYFHEAFATACALAASTKEPLGLALIEIDNFDAAGRKNTDGDREEIIQGVARCLERQARSPLGIAARYAEALFALLLPRGAEIEETLAAIQEEVRTLGSETVTVSIGAITADGANDSPPDALLERVKTVLAGVKSEGGNLRRLVSAAEV